MFESGGGGVVVLGRGTVRERILVTLLQAVDAPGEGTCKGQLWRVIASHTLNNLVNTVELRYKRPGYKYISDKLSKIPKPHSVSFLFTPIVHTEHLISLINDMV